MNSEDEKYKAFQCKICLDMATEPVTTPCGHLYCWQCLYKWAEKKTPLTCPYCYNHFDLDKCTSIFAGESKTRANIPKRPQNKRTEPPPQPRQAQQNQFNMGFGFGFPFMMFSNIDLGNMNYRQLIPLFIWLFSGYIFHFISNLSSNVISHSQRNFSELIFTLLLMFGAFKLLSVGAARLLY